MTQPTLKKTDSGRVHLCTIKVPCKQISGGVQRSRRAHAYLLRSKEIGVRLSVRLVI